MKFIISDDAIHWMHPEHGIITVPQGGTGYSDVLIEYLRNDKETPKILCDMYESMYYARAQQFEKSLKSSAKKELGEESKAREKLVKLTKKLLGDSVFENIESQARSFYKSGLSLNALTQFYYRCLLNPHPESLESLFRFIVDDSLSISPDGCFYAYKVVSETFKDLWTRKINNAPGHWVSMKRNEVVYDPTEDCASGLHVANYEFVRCYAGEEFPRILVKVDPADVVSVPYSDVGKMRVCRYFVVSAYRQDHPLPLGVYDMINNDTCRKSLTADNTFTFAKRPWSKKEYELYTLICGRGFSAQASRILGRQPEDIKAMEEQPELATNLPDLPARTYKGSFQIKATQVDAKPYKHSTWDVDKQTKLIAGYMKGKSFKQLGEKLKVSSDACNRQINRLFAENKALREELKIFRKKFEK